LQQSTIPITLSSRCASIRQGPATSVLRRRVLDAKGNENVNTFTVDPERQEDVIRSLHDVTEMVTRGMPGFVSACVHKDLDGKHVVNYVQWRTRADFEAMLADPRMHNHMREVRQLALDVMPILCSVTYVGEIAIG
jgi:heme-degrading monooxygenase HmoA